MKIICLVACCWLSGGFAVYHTLPVWALLIYGFLSLLYLAAWLTLRRGFYTAK